MGTNYYIEEKDPCPTCGRDFEDSRKHIGKSSAGWCFALHVYLDIGINNLDDWKEFWKDKMIVDEYRGIISKEEMLRTITNRCWNTIEKKDGSWFRMNHAVQGPNNLVRHEIDSCHCIGHGEGTWDLLIGDFS